jgi:Icc-related predicted phosphoesterase
VACGDFTTYGSTDFVNRFLGAFESRVLAVPGNCDPPETVGVLEDAHASLHGRQVTFKGTGFFGFGGGLPSPAHMPFEVDEETMVASLATIGAGGGVMVTHTPPYGMNDRSRSGRSHGSKGILRIAKELRPRLVLSGHMHEARGECEEDGIVFVNPGPAREGFYAVAELGQQVKIDLLRAETMKERRLKTF